MQEKTPTLVRGQYTGACFPTDIGSLLNSDPDVLTQAFRAVGAISQDNRVLAITRAKEFFGGGLGPKLSFDVVFERDEAGVTSELFAKFQMPDNHVYRHVFADVMEPEIRFALFSRRPDFPIRVPQCFFADWDAETKCALLITERVPFGRGELEPQREKCLDYRLDNSLEHYQALTLAMAKLAGRHRAGEFGQQVEQAFPFDRAEQDAVRLIGVDREGLEKKIEHLRTFVTHYPDLLPQHLRSLELVDAIGRDAETLRLGEHAVHRFLNSRDDLVALAHWNLNIDNAWFRRGGNGEMQCGLLDWGSVGQMNLGHAFYGMMSASDHAFQAQHEEELISLFLEEYRAAGGPAADADDFRLSIRLATVLKGVAWVIDGAETLPELVPDLASVQDRTDPRIEDVFYARIRLGMLTTFLSNWQRWNAGALIRELAG